MAASIAEAFPGVPLDWVVQTEFVDAVRAHPAVDRVIPFPRRELNGFWNPFGGWQRTARFLGTLQNGYDLAIDAQGLARSGAMAIFSGARTRVGFSDAREFGWIGVNRRVRVEPGAGAVDRMLQLVEGADIPPVADMRLHVPGDAEEGWSAWRRRELGDGRYVAISPTSRWTSKEWPLDRWIDGPAAGISDFQNQHHHRAYHLTSAHRPQVSGSHHHPYYAQRSDGYRSELSACSAGTV